MSGKPAFFLPDQSAALDTRKCRRPGSVRVDPERVPAGGATGKRTAAKNILLKARTGPEPLGVAA